MNVSEATTAVAVPCRGCGGCHQVQWPHGVRRAHVVFPCGTEDHVTVDRDDNAMHVPVPNWEE